MLEPQTIETFTKHDLLLFALHENNLNYNIPDKYLVNLWNHDNTFIIP